MQPIDYIVLFLYFAGMAGIGFWLMSRQKRQEDFFMGGRSFGKLMQTFAAFGAGTGSADPVNTARGTFNNGMSGMWGVMYWLFVTPVYWISAVWYRRMRCLTLGDWFVERYESKPIGVAYALFGCFYYMVYGAMLFTAIGKVAAPLMGDTLFGVPLQHSLLPLIAIIVVTYGLLGGIAAAYWTDLIQGICIIALSVLLIPFGLNAVVDKFGKDGDGLMDGFRLMHERLGEEAFTIVGGTTASEFPLYAIVAIVIINMIGIVLTPHFLVTGGGTAKSEMDARVGLVSGNLIKRFCTIGWVVTALIVLTLYGSNAALTADADKAWGVATQQLLGPLGIGLVGLMVACLLAALMSSVDCYMLVCSALVVRNIYQPYIKPDAGEAESLRIARIVGALIVAGSVALSLTIYDMFANLQLTWIVPMLFAAVFWVGMYWRRATTSAAWITFTFCLLFFLVLPIAVPKLNPGLVNSPALTRTSHIIESTITRAASPLDISRGKAKTADEQITETKRRGGVALFWTGNVKPTDTEKLREIDRRKVPDGEEVVYEYDCELAGSGRMRLDMLIIDQLGIDLASMNKAAIKTLDLPFATVVPFLVMIAASLLTKPNRREALDRLYVKMKTPVDPDPAGDRAQMERSYAQPDRFDECKLFPGSSLEFQRPSALDFWGFVGCFAICFGIIGLAILVSKIGS
ncbi:MAG: sodium:solute symporter family protein [Verrucomicrobiota bacterium]|jgi:SSS family solute:Na+ symporter|nr:sodium:solute symporter family protein [Verrucomicrobiota bacterium]MDP6250320.1 sodium:solute symporter family protein [Verrucomicrobiota bacterium]MDP7584307.1 sodium:solute symporter family protein [Verrucomicrobiota bacterium]HJN81807.1 sodium:solute symporter family protein [Verrucomicrobiota bacterium]